MFQQDDDSSNKNHRETIMITECPNIPDGWKGGRGQTAKLLGIDPKTLDKYAVLGKKNGGIACIIAPSGRRKFEGSEIKRFWATH